MEWSELLNEIAAHGWTLLFSPAHMFGATSGLKVELCPYQSDEDEEAGLAPPPSVAAIVHFEAGGQIDEKAVLETARDLVERLESD